MPMMLIYLTKRHTVKKNTRSLIVARDETGPEVNAGKIMYITIFRDQNAGRSHNIMMDNNSLDSVE
jgi:hypothetical protein